MIEAHAFIEAQQGLGDARLPNVVDVNIIGSKFDGTPDDNRDNLERRWQQLGLSQQEAALLRESTGYVICRREEVAPACIRTAWGWLLDPSHPKRQTTIGSGFLVESNMQLATAGHIFADRCGRKFDLADCAFETYEGKLYPIDPGNAKAWAGAGLDDHATVLLKAPVVGGRPLQIYRGVPSEGTSIITVSGYQKIKGLSIDNADPVVQACTLKRIVPQGDEGRPSEYRTDCDMEHGMSGGAVIVRENEGLGVVAEMVETGIPALDGHPYDDIHDYSYSSFVALDRDFLRDIVELRGATAQRKGLVRTELPASLGGDAIDCVVRSGVVQNLSGKSNFGLTFKNNCTKPVECVVIGEYAGVVRGSVHSFSNRFGLNPSDVKSFMLSGVKEERAEHDHFQCLMDKEVSDELIDGP